MRSSTWRAATLCPGYIDAHVHIESSLRIPAQFAQAVVPRRVTTAVIDPHEIANVAGLAGVRFMAENSVGLPLGVAVMASPCRPATTWRAAGLCWRRPTWAQLLADGTVHGLAEVMNFPGVAQGDPALLAKLAAVAGVLVTAMRRVLRAERSTPMWWRGSAATTSAPSHPGAKAAWPLTF
jgi:adenine deaminase